MSDAIKTLLLGADTETPATADNPVPVALSGGDVTIGTVKILGVNGVNIAAVDGLGNLAVAGNGPVQPDTAQSGSILTAGIYNSSPPTLTNGQQAALQVDSSGKLLTTATFSGSVNSAAQATTAAPSYSDGTENPFSQNLTGDLRTIAKIASAQTLATVTTVGSISSALPAGSNVIGHVITDTGSTTAVTQATAASLNATVVQATAASLNATVVQATAASLNATVVGTGTFAAQVASSTVPVSTMNSASANSGVNSPMAAVFDDVSPTAITENNFGFVRMSANRNQYTTIRDAAGNERGVNVNASNQLSVSVDGSSATNISTNIAQMNGVAVTMGNGVAGTGVQRVTIASDSTGLIKLAAGANIIGSSGIDQTTAVTTNGVVIAPVTAAAAAIAPVVSASLETGHVIKGSAGNLYGLNVSTTTVAGFVQIFNSTTVPAAGAVTPVKAYFLPASSSLVVGFDPPLRLGTGISVAFSSATTPFTKTDSATAFISGDAV